MSFQKNLKPKISKLKNNSQKMLIPKIPRPFNPLTTIIINQQISNFSILSFIESVQMDL